MFEKTIPVDGGKDCDQCVCRTCKNGSCITDCFDFLKCKSGEHLCTCDDYEAE